MPASPEQRKWVDGVFEKPAKRNGAVVARLVAEREREAVERIRLEFRVMREDFLRRDAARRAA